ncbi:TP53-regulated inhibitor of apoptosis 1 [Orchesella cincta]|uniref:TP53-regulated inhibitor of apoptosis 1 n=1 Tax=Orchesella cincta TaxID=48709 RepID=A0A1D2N4N0_ORCCI|nr:TP53-regulated inhibitor of apoptosis 1 [Orchesella cincta]
MVFQLPMENLREFFDYWFIVSIQAYCYSKVRGKSTAEVFEEQTYRNQNLVARNPVTGYTGKLLNHNPKVMDSLDKKCNDLKHAYDSCFNTWFSEKFLKSQFKEACPCDSIMKLYAECVKEAMKARNMDPVLYAKHWEESPMNKFGDSTGPPGEEKR